VRVIYASVTETNQLSIVTREVVAAARESLVIGVMSRPFIAEDSPPDT
jgi:hypothetical protein